MLSSLLVLILQESVGDLISILKNLQIDMDKIKLVLKDKKIIE